MKSESEGQGPEAETWPGPRLSDDGIRQVAELMEYHRQLLERGADELEKLRSLSPAAIGRRANLALDRWYMEQYMYRRWGQASGGGPLEEWIFQTTLLEHAMGYRAHFRAVEHTEKFWSRKFSEIQRELATLRDCRRCGKRFRRGFLEQEACDRCPQR